MEVVQSGMQIEQKPLESAPSQAPIPTHVAVIMDGNGRWAEQRGIPRLGGHRAGTENIRRVVRRVASYGVRFLTLYAFSTENWSRPHDEVSGLLGILQEVILREAEALHQDGVRLNHLGRLDRLDPALREAIVQVAERTQHNDGITLNVAFDYGGREEILQAVRRIVEEGIPPQQVNELLFQSYLYTATTPDPDLIIRTAGELRLSNFLLWQAAYSEYYTTPVLWPDFGEREITKALEAYQQRQRRFGGLCLPGGE